MPVILVKLLQTVIIFCLILARTPSSSAEIVMVKFEQCTIFVGIVEPGSAKRRVVTAVHLFALITVGGYGTDGTLKAARDMHVMKGFKPENYSLKQVRLVVFQGMIFINCDPEAPDFVKPLSNISAQLGAYDLENAKIAEAKTYRVDANWKLCLENYLECYHCASSHKHYAKLHTLQALAHKVKPINEAMWARAEEMTGVAGIADEYYG